MERFEAHGGGPGRHQLVRHPILGLGSAACALTVDAGAEPKSTLFIWLSGILLRWSVPTDAKYRLLRLPWLAARHQWRRFPVTWLWRYEKIGQLYAECMSQILQGFDCGVLSTTFDTSNVGWLASGHKAQSLLREAFCNPKASQIPTNQLASFHERRSAPLAHR